ncbi:MAG: hypothetical protein RLZZ543_2204 [Bacteroidota bacterium]|jgi:nitroreductase
MSIRREKPGMSNHQEHTFVFEPTMTTTTIALLPAILNRRSHRSFEKKAISQEHINLLFEAARWAPSAMNAQPWEYLYATPENADSFNRMVEGLNPPNQIWAKNAGLLMICTVAKTYENGNPYRHNLHDAGLANAQLLIQASALGLSGHIMGGINAEQLAESFSISPNHEIVCCIAVGYPGDGSDLENDQLRQRENAPRLRKDTENVARKA